VVVKHCKKVEIVEKSMLFVKNTSNFDTMCAGEVNGPNKSKFKQQ
jgi:hypothetical protein